MNKNLPATLKKIRQQKGLTQQQMAEQFKIKQYNVAKYENGQTVPPGDVLFKILAEYLKEEMGE